MLMKPCPKCGKLYQYGKPYCPECMPIYEARRAERSKQSRKRYDENRKDDREVKFWKSGRWRKLAQATAGARGYKCERCGATIGERSDKCKNCKRDHKCEHCGVLLYQVHHKVDIHTEEGWHRRFDPSNLELLCMDCHNAEHGRFQKRKQR